MSQEMTNFTLNDVHMKLSEKVSDSNAKLLLHAVTIGAGFRGEKNCPLNKEDAKTICLELIKMGGPAFQVGKALYSQVQ